jgi:hypothetical protein
MILPKQETIVYSLLKHNIDLLKEVHELKQLLRAIIAHAGHPDAAEGCRIIIERCKEAIR